MYKFKFTKESEVPEIIRRFQIISRYKFYGERRVCPEDFIFENIHGRIFLIHSVILKDESFAVLELLSNGEWQDATISTEIIDIAESRVLSWKINQALKQAIIDKKHFKLENLLIIDRSFEMFYRAIPETKVVEKIIYKPSDILGIYKLQKLVYDHTSNTVNIALEKPYFAVITKHLYRRLRKDSDRLKLIAEKITNAQS